MPDINEIDQHERMVVNEEIARIILRNKFVELGELNHCLKFLQKVRLEGNMPPKLNRLVTERKLAEPALLKALDIAVERYERERETTQFKIKGYRLTKKIGSGGLGIVFQAWQLSMKRPVAIKILYDRWAKDVEFKSRFLLEARVMGRLSHQNLIQVYDVGRESNHLYFAMEFIEGGTVEQMIHDSGGLPPHEALGISLQVLRAIHYISGYDIVHRDIKPANILMSKSGTAKLGDFGFLLTKNEAALAQEGYVIGTPDYISPEQASGRNVDIRSDIYSLGVCLYHMISGDLPYHGTASTVMRQHVSGDLPSQNPKRGNKISADIYNVLCKMMAKDPDDRYSDIKALMEELNYLKANEILKKGRLHSSPIAVEPPSTTLDATESARVASEQVEILSAQNRRLYSMLVGSMCLAGFLLLIMLFK